MIYSIECLVRCRPVRTIDFPSAKPPKPINVEQLSSTVSGRRSMNQQQSICTTLGDDRCASSDISRIQCQMILRGMLRLKSVEDNLSSGVSLIMGRSPFRVHPRTVRQKSCRTPIPPLERCSRRYRSMSGTHKIDGNKCNCHHQHRKEIGRRQNRCEYDAA